MPRASLKYNANILINLFLVELMHYFNQRIRQLLGRYYILSALLNSLLFGNGWFNYIVNLYSKLLQMCIKLLKKLLVTMVLNWSLDKNTLLLLFRLNQALIFNQILWALPFHYTVKLYYLINLTYYNFSVMLSPIPTLMYIFVANITVVLFAVLASQLRLIRAVRAHCG